MTFPSSPSTTSTLISKKPHRVLENPVFIQRIFAKTNCESYLKPAIFNSVCTAWSEAIQFYSAAAFYWKGTLKFFPTAYQKLHRVLFWCCFNNIDGWIFTNLLAAIRMVDRQLGETFFLRRRAGSNNTPITTALEYSKNIEMCKKLLTACRRLGTDYFKKHLLGECGPDRDSLLKYACKKIKADDVKSQDFCIEFMKVVIEHVNKLHENEQEAKRVEMIRTMLGAHGLPRITPLNVLCVSDKKLFVPKVMDFLLQFIEELGGIDYVKFHLELAFQTRFLLIIPATPFQTVCRNVHAAPIYEYFFGVFDRVGGKEYMIQQLESRCGHQTPFQTFCATDDTWQPLEVSVLQFFIRKFEEIGERDYLRKQLSMRDNEGRSALLLAMGNAVCDKDAMAVFIDTVMKLGGVELFTDLISLNLPDGSVRDQSTIGFRAIEAILKRRRSNVDVMAMICDILFEQQLLLPALAGFSVEGKDTLSRWWKVDENYQSRRSKR